MALKNLLDIFPNKSDREDFSRCEKKILYLMRGEMCREDRIVAYLRYYAPFYGRNKKKKLHGCGERKISQRTGLSIWRVRMIIKSFSEQSDSIPEIRSYQEIS